MVKPIAQNLGDCRAEEKIVLIVDEEAIPGESLGSTLRTVTGGNILSLSRAGSWGEETRRR